MAPDCRREPRPSCAQGHIRIASEEDDAVARRMGDDERQRHPEQSGGCKVPPGHGWNRGEPSCRRDRIGIMPAISAGHATRSLAAAGWVVFRETPTTCPLWASHRQSLERLQRIANGQQVLCRHRERFRHGSSPLSGRSIPNWPDGKSEARSTALHDANELWRYLICL